MLPTEKFWSDNQDYINRNRSGSLNSIASRMDMFDKAFDRTHAISTVCELGANIGLNIVALRYLLRGSSFYAVEINPEACKELEKVADQVENVSIFDWEPKRFDLVFTRGVLIHIPPDKLPEVYEKIYQAAGCYILLAEYYSPKAQAIEYHGRNDLLWKRDFSAEMLDRYPDLSVVNYGFCWDRDPIAPQDNVTWVLMEKK